VEPNPRIPDFLRTVTWVECVVVASAAAMLYLAPHLGGQDYWAWRTPPFNARYVGAIYLGALVPLVILAITARWSPGRIVLWMIFTFTAAIMVVMLAYAGRFEWARFATWVFWALYLFLPVNSAVFLWRLRGLPVPDLVEQGRAARAALTLLAVAFGGYGLALIVIPDDATSFWPWPVDAFHARIYAATYLTPAVGTWVVRRAGSLAEYRTLGLTMVTFGLAAIGVVLLTDSSVSAGGFYAINALAVLIGAALLSAARASAPAATPA
jgi:hypothetical protein